MDSRALRRHRASAWAGLRPLVSQLISASLLAASLLSSAYHAANADPLDPAARRQSEGSAWELWELTGSFGGDYRVFARFMITNSGPGSETGIAVGHVVDPSGKAHRFKNGRLQSRWILSPDGIKLDIGKSHLDMSGSSYRLLVEKNSIKLDLTFTPQRGTAIPPKLLPPDTHMELLDPAAESRGTVWLEGMEDARELVGRVGFVHLWAKELEQKLFLRRIEFFSLQKENPVYLVDITAVDGRRSHFISATTPSKTLYSHGAGLGLTGSAPAHRDSNYWIPGGIEFETPGPISGRVSLGKQFLEHDPISMIPSPLKFWLSRGMEPRQVWAEAGFHVTLFRSPAEPPLHSQGAGVTVVTFLNTLVRPLQSDQ